MSAPHTSEVIADITIILADGGISIDAVLQWKSMESEDQKSHHPNTQDALGLMHEALVKMQDLTTVLAPIVSLSKEALA